MASRNLRILVLFTFIFFNSCGIYKFSGISLSPDVKTVSVDYFQNMSTLVVPTLSNTFTDALKQKLIKQTRLEMLQQDGDIQFSGVISNYKTESVAITGDEVAQKNRLTITVKVKYVNLKDESQSFDKEFSAYDDYPGQASVDAYQAQLIEKITETLTENIFNAALANW